MKISKHNAKLTQYIIDRSSNDTYKTVLIEVNANSVNEVKAMLNAFDLRAEETFDNEYIDSISELCTIEGCVFVEEIDNSSYLVLDVFFDDCANEDMFLSLHKAMKITFSNRISNNCFYIA